MQIYVVQEGDNVDSIAAQMGIPVETLIYDNQIEYPYRLAVGQALFISGGNYGASSSGTGGTRPPLFVSGYAYPFIQQQILEDTLPWLTAVNVFSYGFTTQGELVPPTVDPAWMVREARRQNVRPVLTLTPLGADGHFNNNLVTALVSSRRLQQKLVWNLGSTMEQLDYGGLDIDFEYIQAPDREAFAEFVSFTTQVMNLFGYPVTVALAPKTSRDQPGLLYEGVDSRLLGMAANRAMLMTYEWGYTYGPPMAVAPLPNVRAVLDYAVTEIPAEKIFLGVPNYGYDWPLPFVQGTTRAQSISNQRAIELAVQYGVAIEYDETAQSPFFHYTDAGGTVHEVWFEDARSMDAKLRLIAEYGFQGAGFWNLMRPFSQTWLVLDSLYDIRD